MKKVLFIAAHRKDRSPSQRFRFEQFFDYLESEGYQCELSNIITAADDQYLYKPGHYFRKAWIFLKSVVKRTRDVIKAKNVDIVFVQREAFMTGSTFFERQLKRTGTKMIFDFDDSIWMQDESPVNNKLSWLKNASKTSTLIRLSDMVFAGNEYLADYARQFNDHVVIVPTTIDTEEYQVVPSESEAVVIGWSGSFSTVKHFEQALPALEIIKEKYGEGVKVVLVGDGSYTHAGLGIVGLPWRKDTELADLSRMDIGIMPLPDDAWSKGKCGLKGLQYMALKIPTIMSPVGVNSEIIEDGVNGFLADTTANWVEKISQLIDSEILRKEVGEKGYQTVLQKYSVAANKALYVKHFNSLLVTKRS